MTRRQICIVICALPVFGGLSLESSLSSAVCSVSYTWIKEGSIDVCVQTR